MRLKICAIVIGFSTFLGSCRSEPITGYYVSYKPGFLTSVWAWAFSSGYITGNSIQLKPDSTFVYVTCGNVMKGNWSGKGKDTILLYIRSNYGRAPDSAGKHKKYSCGTGPAIFILKRNGDLEERFRSTIRRKKWTAINRLSKPND